MDVFSLPDNLCIITKCIIIYSCIICITECSRGNTDATLWFSIKPPEKVSLKAAMEGQPVDLDTAYESQVQIKLLEHAMKQSTDEDQKLEIYEASINHAIVVSRYEQESSDNIHKLAKCIEWGEHDDRVHFNEDGEPLFKYDDFSGSVWGDK